MRELGADCLSKEMQAMLVEWLQYCLCRLTCYRGGIPIVDSFSAVLQQLTQFF